MTYNLFDEDTNYYDEYDDFNDSDDYDDPYDENYIPCPDVTLREVVKKWFFQIRRRLYSWRHRDEINESPF